MVVVRKIFVPKNPFTEKKEEVQLAIPIKVQDGLTGNDLAIAIILALNEKLKEVLEPEVTIQYECVKELVKQC